MQETRDNYLQIVDFLNSLDMVLDDIRISTTDSMKFRRLDYCLQNLNKVTNQILVLAKECKN